MTKPIVKKAQAEDILKSCRKLVSSPHATAEIKEQCVTMAYELGCSQGRVDGGKDMADHLLASLKAAKVDAVPA